jgi:DNA-binding GntR family transcriptional regulator
MALLATSSLAVEGRDVTALQEHSAIVEAIANNDGEGAYKALKAHISVAFETRLRSDAEGYANEV